MDTQPLSQLGPVWVLSAKETEPISSVGSALATEDGVSYPYIDGAHVMRLTGGDVTTIGVPDFSGTRAFTVLAWVRATREAIARRIMVRRNGSTEVSLSIGADGTLEGFVSSTVGRHHLQMQGASRIDDEQWHLAAIRSTPQRTGILGIDQGGLDADLWVDGAQAKRGWIHPGLFSPNPKVVLTTPIVVGRDVDGSAALHGDVALVAAFSKRLRDSDMRSVWALRPTHTAPRMGWGIFV